MTTFGIIRKNLENYDKMRLSIVFKADLFTWATSASGSMSFAIVIEITPFK